ncbi:MAG TPA: hypothetical protein VFP68_09870 [Burkholderiaceae bacterium]|nr:hypothetical protein [Burkholderiaceae bacterium]
MKTVHIAILISAALSAHLTYAVERGSRVEAPASLRNTGNVETVLYRESVGELPMGSSVRPTMEKTCAGLRELGETTKTPIFEPGDDRPMTSESVKIGNSRHTVSFLTITNYDCDWSINQANRDSCGCTFRRLQWRKMHLKRIEGDLLHIYDIDITRGVGTHHSRRRGSRTILEEGKALVPGLAPPRTIGHSEYAGIPCVVKRADVSAVAWSEYCVVEDQAHHWPPEIQSQILGATQVRLHDGIEDRTRWEHTTRVVINATVDAGVFEVPPGIKILDLDKVRAK